MKIYEVDPLICPECQGAMRVIDDPSVIRAILEHLGLWLARARPPPKIHDPPTCLHCTGRSAAPSIADDVSQFPLHGDHVYGDPQYSWDDYIQAWRIVKPKNRRIQKEARRRGLSEKRFKMPS